MEGDLEDELRLAMAEQVREATASHGLAGDVTRRFRRRVRRRRLTSVVALAAATVAVFPVYRALTPAGGAMGPAGAHTTVTGSATPVPPVPRAPSLPPRSGSTPAPRAPKPGGSAGRSISASPPSVSSSGVVIMGYLPAGLRSTGSCRRDQTGSRATTTCQWSGAGGTSVVVRIVHDPGMNAPADLGLSLLLQQPVTVGGRSGVAGNRFDGGREVAWIDRAGVAVDLSVSARLGGQLMRIAQGIHVA